MKKNKIINQIQKIILFFLFLMANNVTLPYQNQNTLLTSKIFLLGTISFISCFLLIFFLFGNKKKLERILINLDTIISCPNLSELNWKIRKQKIEEIIKKIYPSLDKIEADDFPILLCLAHIFIQNHLECTEMRHIECKISNESSWLHKLYDYNFYNNSIAHFSLDDSLLSKYIKKAIHKAITPNFLKIINPSKSLLYEINQEEENAFDNPESEYSKKIETFITSELKQDDNKIAFLNLLSKQSKKVSEAAIRNKTIDRFNKFDTEETLLKNLSNKIKHIKIIFNQKSMLME